MSDHAAAAAPTVFYDTVLKPHRSLPPKGFVVLMLVLAGASFAIGLVFVLNGAWPVTPFFGLDVGLVYLAFRLSYRQARQTEALQLTEDSLTAVSYTHLTLPTIYSV